MRQVESIQTSASDGHSRSDFQPYLTGKEMSGKQCRVSSIDAAKLSRLILTAFILSQTGRACEYSDTGDSASDCKRQRWSQGGVRL